MTPERWRRVKELFGEAVEPHEGERGEFLARACGGDEGLAAEVRRLVVARPGGTGERVLATRRGPEWMAEPAWSPDGRTTVCTLRDRELLGPAISPDGRLDVCARGATTYDVVAISKGKD